MRLIKVFTVVFLFVAAVDSKAATRCSELLNRAFNFSIIKRVASLVDRSEDADASHFNTDMPRENVWDYLRRTQMLANQKIEGQKMLCGTTCVFNLIQATKVQKRMRPDPNVQVRLEQFVVEHQNFNGVTPSTFLPIIRKLYADNFGEGVFHISVKGAKAMDDDWLGYDESLQAVGTIRQSDIVPGPNSLKIIIFGFHSAGELQNGHAVVTINDGSGKLRIVDPNRPYQDVKLEYIETITFTTPKGMTRLPAYRYEEKLRRSSDEIAIPLAIFEVVGI